MKNGTGLKKETAAAIATLFGPTVVVPVLFLLIEKDEFVRFWAMQSIVTSALLFVVLWGIGIFAFTIVLAPLVAFINGLLMLLGFVLWLIYVYKSWQGERWSVPIVGNIAQNLLKKVK
ncbi:MAG TPA: hypothetical protein VKC53_00330 [Patescibacteria group bacterium]|nr:hypothetical protein [Patescibacteria group bacterium]